MVKGGMRPLQSVSQEMPGAGSPQACYLETPRPGPKKTGKNYSALALGASMRHGKG